MSPFLENAVDSLKVGLEYFLEGAKDLLDSPLPCDSSYFLTAYNLGKKVGDRRVVFQTWI